MNPPSSKPHAAGLAVVERRGEVEPGVENASPGSLSVAEATVLSIVMPALRAAVVPLASVPT